VDHLIPRDLGGADVMDNLWPQIWSEARKKDRLEVKLRKLVCARALPLREAQDRVAKDWAALYLDVFGEQPR
jgi:5-methylcytosine-specific restriction endonuclease McrA